MKVIAQGLMFPEGPVAMADGSIVVGEIAKGCLTRISPTGTLDVISELGGGPNGVARGPDGRLYVCNNGGVSAAKVGPHLRLSATPPDDYSGGRIEAVDIQSGKSEVLYDSYMGKRLSAPNDLVFDRSGGFYFSDFGKSWPSHTDHGAIYYGKADGSELVQVISPIPGPNGVGLSPDGSTLYVAETPSARLWCWEISSPGIVKKLPYPAFYGGGRLVGAASGLARFDSLAVAASGKVCVATLIDGGITEFAPDGSSSRRHPLPDMSVTNLCFGGPFLRTCYVTLSQVGWLVELPWHESGLRLNYQQ